MSARLTPREAQGHARLTDMLETVRLVKGEAFHSVTYAALQARAAMAAYDRAGGQSALAPVRIAKAQELVLTVRQLARDLSLPPGQFHEAMKHARAMYREGFMR